MSILVEKKLQIRAHKVIAYTKFTGYHFRTDKQRASAELFSKRNIELEKIDPDTGEVITEKKIDPYSGELRDGARKRLIKAIDLLVQSTKRTWIDHPHQAGKKMPFQIAFTTLTVHSPERMIDAKEAYKNLLAPFLQWLRRSQNVYLYIWKAELQQRGQIHYHLLLGSFVDQEKLRIKWNKLQKEHGYLDMYFSEHGHYNAPSTEIKNALEHEDISGYLIKEVAKTIQNQKGINGKVWDCSMNLKEMSYFEADSNKYAGVISELVRQSKLVVGYTDRNCTVYKANDYKPTGFLDRLDNYLYNDHIDFIKSTEYVKPVRELYQPPPKPKINIGIQNKLFFSN